MSMMLTREVRDTYVWFGLSGPSDVAELMAHLKTIGQDAQARALSAIAIDLLMMQSRVTTADRFSLGEAAAVALRGIDRIAVIQPPSELRGFAAMVASNRGTAAESFTSLADAEGWLRG
ncbi:hypothetical protein BH11PSE7_BH11PSE7_31890 [soil metagenome]